MPAQPRFLRILKWLTLALCLLTFAAMAASGLRTIYYEAHGWGFRLDEGILTAHWGFPSESVPPGRGLYGWNFRPMTTRLGFRLLFPKLESWPDGRTILYLGVWILLAPLTAATALLWWLDRRKIPPGHCRRCGYNLTANTSGRCPECGTGCLPNTGATMTTPQRSRIRRILEWKIIDAERIAILRPLLRRTDARACKEYPELARVPDLSARRELQGRANRRAVKSRGLLYVAALSLITLAILLYWEVDLRSWVTGEDWIPANPRQAISRDLIGGGAWLLGSVVYAYCLVRFMSRRHRHALRIELTESGFLTCVNCGYDLTGNTSGRCPECGTVCVPSASGT